MAQAYDGPYQMQRTGRIRAWCTSQARNVVLYFGAGALWAVLVCGPAGAPEARVTAAPRQLSVFDSAMHTLTQRMASLRPAVAEAMPVTPAILWPAPGPLTGWFGERRGGTRHPGLDIDGTTGDDVVAASAGRVTVAGRAPAGYAGYGTVVIIDHGDDVVSIYAHLSGVVTHAGDQVAPGQLLGFIGTSGSVTGSHLHFELRRRGTALDPRSWLPAR